MSTLDACPKKWKKKSENFKESQSEARVTSISKL